MGDFFTNPKERAAKTLFEQVQGGSTPWSGKLAQMAGSQKSELETSGNEAIAKGSGDILSQLISGGVAPGSGEADIVGKQATGVRSGIQKGQSQIDVGQQGAEIQSLMSMLQSAMGGMSSASTGGDLMSGLTMLAQMGAGIGMMGGPQGFDWWKGVTPNDPGKPVKGSGTSFG